MKILKEQEEEAKKRCNAWWDGGIVDRPPIILTAPKINARLYDGPDTDDLDDWWTNPDFVLPRFKHTLENTAWLGEAFPMVLPMGGGLVAILAKYLGGPNSYIDKSTAWTGNIIEDWENREKLEIREDNEFWVKTKNLMEKTIEMIRAEDLKAYVGGPDLNGPTEVLSGLRNPQKFAMDFYDHPEMIKPALREVQDAWYKAWDYTSNKAHELGGWFSWLRVWSDIPAIDLQSDVSCLMSEDHFNEYLLPFIAEQTERVPRTLYHLDGPDAIRHMDSLLDLPGLNVLQWIHGAGNGPMVKWTDLLKKAQAAGKSPWITCRPWEIEPLLRELNPEGCLFITDTVTEEEGRQLIDHVDKNWKNW